MPLHYALIDEFTSSEVPIYQSIREIPSLGRVSRPEAVNSPQYLVLPSGLSPKIRSIRRFDGTKVYTLDQENNPDSMILETGGVYDALCVVAGRFATISRRPLVEQIQSSIARAVQKSFEKTGTYYVGPRAKALHYEKGLRLVTIGLREPVEYDLKLKNGEPAESKA